MTEAFPTSKIFIFYHNDPTKLRGSKSVEERNLLNNKCVNIFLSKYIKKVKKYQADIISLEHKHTLPKYFHNSKKIIYFSRNRLPIQEP